MDHNVKLFEAKSEVPRRGVERADQGKASEQIGLGWSDHSTENSRVIVSKRSEKIRLY